MKVQSLIGLVLIALVVTACSGTPVPIGPGVIKEGADTAEKAIKGIRDAALTSWADTSITIPAQQYEVFNIDKTFPLGYYKKVSCTISAEHPINIYAMEASQLDLFKANQNFSYFNACSQKNTDRFECGESCNVPADTIFVLQNNGDVSAKVNVDLKYFAYNASR